MDAVEEERLCKEVAELEVKIGQLKALIASVMMRTDLRFDRFFRKTCNYVI